MTIIKKMTIVLLGMLFISSAFAGHVEEIGAVNKKIEVATAAQDIDEVVKYYTEDNVFLAPQAPILVGKDAVGAFYRQAIEMGAVRLEIQSLEIKKIAWNKAVEVGHNTIYFYNPETGETIPSKNKFMVVWKKTRRGWKVFYDMYNALPQ